MSVPRVVAFPAVALGPTLRRRQLINELRRLREVAGLTIDDVAALTGVSKSTVSRIENGQVGVKVPVLRELMRAYQVTEDRRESLERLAREASRRGWWQTVGDLPSQEWKTLVGLEAEASKINDFSSLVINGLLQTREYASALVGNLKRDDPEDAINALVDLRIRRQQRLGELDYWAILAEEVLHRHVGGSEVMSRQLRHIASMARKPRIRIQVLPFPAGEHVGLRGPFTVFEFDPVVELSAVYLEGNRWEACIEGMAEVAPYKKDFEALRAQAMNERESLSLIEDITERIGR